MRTFELHRLEDETGISGIGIIAEGVEFSDGTCALRWKTSARSTAIYDNLKSLEQIHGHQGKTKIIYTGGPFDRGFGDAAQDACENAPFASVGGLERRDSLVAPAYITPDERQAYLRGYEMFAMTSYGKDWRTCGFGWNHVLTLGESARTARTSK